MGKRAIEITDFVALFMKKYPSLGRLIKNIAHKAFPETVALLDYPINLRQRWSQDHPHQTLYDIINENRDVYTYNLKSFLQLSEYLTLIPERQLDGADSIEPYWINQWLPALDGVALYGFIALNKPKLYIEVGSGYSTKFARKAIVDHGLETKIVSIDPRPRAEINKICDEIIRKPVEEIDLEVFDRLEANDILFIDNSHRVFMNSDVTTIFLDVIPRLKPGVMLEIHDVWLPYDYPVEWSHRYYSEQYLLAAYILAKGQRFDTILPNMFITHSDDLKNILSPLWKRAEMKNVLTSGGSFWMRMK
jgi:hypothetical protein